MTEGGGTGRVEVDADEVNAMYKHVCHDGGEHVALALPPKDKDRAAKAAVVDSEQALVSFCRKHNGDGYMAISLNPMENPKSAGTKNEVAAIANIAMDIDVKKEYRDKGLAPKEMQQKAIDAARVVFDYLIEQFNLHPSILVSTGNGAQVVIPLSMPLPSEREARRRRVDQIESRITALYENVAALVDVDGIDVDPKIKGIQSKIKIAGTHNLKHSEIAEKRIAETVKINKIAPVEALADGNADVFLSLSLDGEQQWPSAPPSQGTNDAPEDVRDALRPCMLQGFEGGERWDESEGHTFRLAVAVDLIQAGCSDKDITEFFKEHDGQSGEKFDEGKTRRQVSHARQSGYNRFKCGTLRKKASGIVQQYCADCDFMGRETTSGGSKIRYRANIGPQEELIVTDGGYEIWGVKEKEDEVKRWKKYDVVKGRVIPTKKLYIDDEIFYEAETESTFRGDANDLRKLLERQGKITKRSKASDSINMALQGMPMQEIYGHGTYGIYEDEAEALSLCLNPYPLTDEHDDVIREIQRAGSIDQDITAEAIKNYTEIFDFWHRYEILPVVGLCTIAPFGYVLRDHGFMVPHLYLYSPESGIGKTEAALVGTEYLYGKLLQTADAVASEFRVSTTLDSFGGPVLADEATNINRRGVRSLLLTSAERPLCNKRGDRSLGTTQYHSRAALLMTGNSFPFSKKSLLIRCIKIRYDMNAKPQRTDAMEEYEARRKKLQPIGWRLTEIELEAMDYDVTTFLEAVERHEHEIGDRVPFEDIRRARAWAAIYEGLMMWQRAAEKYGIGWTAPSYNDFVESIVRPIEADTFETLQIPAEDFIAWWENWKVHHTVKVEKINDNAGGYSEYDREVKGKDEIWRTATIKGRDGMFDFITNAVFQEYKKRRQRDIEMPVQSMAELAEGISQLTGIPKDTLYGQRRVGGHPRWGIHVPLDIMEAENGT